MKSWRWLLVLSAIWAALLAYWLFLLVQPWKCPPNAFTCLPPNLWLPFVAATLIAAVLPFGIVWGVAKKRGWWQTILGWYVIAVAAVGGFLTTLARELPADIALEWKLWGLIVSLLTAAAGIWLVVWGRQVSLRAAPDSN